jgi:hypothetical protein
MRPDGRRFPSIINVTKITTIINTIFPNMDESFIKSYQELLSIGQSEIYITSVPDFLNEKDFSIFNIHPTYQYHTSQDPAFAYQDPDTKQFNILLNRCMSVLFGETVSEDIIENIIDDKKYRSFTCANVEYHVLTEESYKKAMS